MNKVLLSHYHSDSQDALKLVLFGGNPVMRDEVIRHLSTIPQLDIYGTLSEAEGYQFFQDLGKVDMVLIGGRYSGEQRKRIRNFINQHTTGTKILEPRVSFPYSLFGIYKLILNIIQNENKS